MTVEDIAKLTAGFESRVLLAPGGGGKVNFEKNLIEGVAILEAGREAAGHGFWVDSIMVDQAIKLGNEAEPIGLKSRFNHPSWLKGALGSFLGRLHNFRRDGDIARADFQLDPASKVSPSGDLSIYILTLADSDPAALMFSIDFIHAMPAEVDAGEHEDERELQFLLPHARIKELRAADVVDEGAATSALFTTGSSTEDQETKKEELHKMKTEEQLTAAQTEVAEVKVKLTAAVGAVAKHTDELSGAKILSFKEGKEASEARLASLLTKYKKLGDKTADFVISNFEKTDSEIQDAYIELLEDGNVEKKIDEDAENLGAGGDDQVLGGGKDDKKTYMGEVRRVMKENGVGKLKAHNFVQQAEPKLYQASLEQRTEEK